MIALRIVLVTWPGIHSSVAAPSACRPSTRGHGCRPVIEVSVFVLSAHDAGLLEAVECT